MRKFIYTFFVSLLVLLCSCTLSEPVPYFRTTFAFDTYLNITIYSSENQKQCEKLCDEICDSVNKLEMLISANNEKSEIYRINADKNKEITANEEIIRLTELCKDASARSKGAFDFTLGRIKRLWGFYDEGISPDFEKIKQLSGKENYNNILTENSRIIFSEKDFELDFGGVAKGYALDKIKELLTENKIQKASIDFGGSICVIGEGKEENGEWKIGISADENNIPLGVIKVKDSFISTSNGGKRFVEYNGVKYHHILDGKTGFPADSDIRSCTIICDNGAYSDILSTAIFVCGSENAEKIISSFPCRTEFIIIKKDGNVILSKGISEKYTSYDK